MQLYQPTITGSLSVSGSINLSGSITIAGGGTISGTASIATNAITASSADNFLVRNTLTAQTLVVQTITSSVSTITGSTNFGSLAANTHAFTGSVSMTGSLAVVTTGTEFQVTSTGVNLGNALTDSHVISGSLRVNPNGLFVSGSGLVGIGTSSPSFLLDLQRSSAGADVVLRVQNTAAGTINDASVLHLGWSSNLAGYSSIITDRGGRAGTSAAQGSLYFNANQDAVERIRMTIRADSGNVGIGRTDPSFILDVNDTNASGARGIRISTSSTSVGPALFLWSNSGTNTNWNVGTSYSTGNALEFVSSNSVGGNPGAAGTTRMLITNTGITQINGTNGGVRLTLQNTDNTGYLAFTEQEMRMWRPDGSGANLVIATQAITGTFGGSIVFTPLNVERMRIGGTGIITLRADSNSIFDLLNLHNVSGTSSGTRIKFQNFFGDLAAIRVSQRDNGSLADDGFMEFQVASNAALGTKFSIRNDGLISFPQINDFTTGNSPNTWINPASSYGIYINTSSIRYKRDVVNYDKGIDTVNQLRPVYYKGKSDIDGDKQFAGFIAEEIHDLGLTEFVQYNEEGLPNSLAYPNMITLAIKAIQELKAEFDAYKTTHP